jgi:hypothetical protein
MLENGFEDVGFTAMHWSQTTHISQDVSRDLKVIREATLGLINHSVHIPAKIIFCMDLIRLARIELVAFVKKLLTMPWYMLFGTFSMLFISTLWWEIIGIGMCIRKVPLHTMTAMFTIRTFDMKKRGNVLGFFRIGAM